MADKLSDAQVYALQALEQVRQRKPVDSLHAHRQHPSDVAGWASPRHKGGISRATLNALVTRDLADRHGDAGAVMAVWRINVAGRQVLRVVGREEDRQRGGDNG